MKGNGMEGVQTSVVPQLPSGSSVEEYKRYGSTSFEILRGLEYESKNLVALHFKISEQLELLQAEEVALRKHLEKKKSSSQKTIEENNNVIISHNNVIIKDIINNNNNNNNNNNMEEDHTNLNI